jgi:hypothetical protein
MKLSKYIYKLACGALVLSALTSCGNDWLNVSPYDGVPSETALNNSAALESARTGMYKALKGTSDFVDYYGRNMFVYGDVRGEDVSIMLHMVVDELNFIIKWSIGLQMILAKVQLFGSLH